MCCKFAIYATASTFSLVGDCLFKFGDCRLNLGFEGVVEFFLLNNFLADVGVITVHKFNKVVVEGNNFIDGNIRQKSSNRRENR